MSALKKRSRKEFNDDYNDDDDDVNIIDDEDDDVEIYDENDEEEEENEEKEKLILKLGSISNRDLTNEVESEEEEEEEEEQIYYEEEEQIIEEVKPPPRKRQRTTRSRNKKHSNYEDYEESNEINVKKLTRRQRALLQKQNVIVDNHPQEELLSLPMDTKQDRVLTEEELLKKSEALRKRRRQAQQQLEDEKKAVMKRLLLSSIKETEEKDQDETSSRNFIDLIGKHRIETVYKRDMNKEKNNENDDGKKEVNSVYVSFPENYKDFNINLTLKLKKENLKCFFCDNDKKYTHKSGQSICSLQCYNKIVIT